MGLEPPLLFTPGPLSTHAIVREAMLRDWGSRTTAFIDLTAELRSRLTAVGRGEQTHTAIPLQGSGTYAVEAALGTLVRTEDRLLVLSNGAYGDRMGEIAARLGRRAEKLSWPEGQPMDVAEIGRALSRGDVTHLAVVHCETSCGILNPVEQIAALTASQGVFLIVDAMSSFGALPLDLARLKVGAALTSSNKCLEGAPGIGVAIVERKAVGRTRGWSPSVSLDLHAQWAGFEADGQWRFTPPVQVVAALVEALRRLELEGGPEARLRRYERNLESLLAVTEAAGLKPVLDRAVQSPIIVAFHTPTTAGFRFERFAEALAARNLHIYPGKLGRLPSFRIGCIGALDAPDFVRLGEALGPALAAAVGP